MVQDTDTAPAAITAMMNFNLVFIMNYHVFLFWPEQAKPSGHDEAAVLKPKLPLILCKLLMIDTYTPRPTRSGWKHENYM